MGLIQAGEDLKKKDRGPSKTNEFCHHTTTGPEYLWTQGCSINSCWNWQPSSLLSRFWTHQFPCSLLLYTPCTPPPPTHTHTDIGLFFWRILSNTYFWQWTPKFSDLRQQKYCALMNACALMSLQGCNQGICWNCSLLSRPNLLLNSFTWLLARSSSTRFVGLNAPFPHWLLPKGLPQFLATWVLHRGSSRHGSWLH